MNKFTLLKTMMLTCMLMIGMGAWADSYTITFGNNANSATALTSSTKASTVISAGTDYVTASPFTVNSGNIYYGDTQTCIRLGKSGNASSLSIELSTTGQVNATEVTVNCDNTGGKNNSNATLSVNGTAAQTTTTSADDYNFTLNGTKIESLTLAASASVRVYSITVTYTTGPAKTLSSIAVKTAPTKVTYTEGEFFAPTGLVVTKTFDDSSTEDVSYASYASAFTFSPSLTTALQTTDANVQITVGGKSTTQAITVNAIPTHTAHFSVNGTINNGDDSTVKEGQAITFPADPADIYSKTFVGWTKTSDYSNATTAPSDLCKSANMGNNDVTYYAVFATQKGSSTPQTVTWNINGVATSAAGGSNVNTALNTSSITPSTETGIWTAVASSSYAATSSSKAQLGSGSYKFAGTITLSGTTIPSTAMITGIDLTATSSATDANPYTIMAYVNDELFGTASHMSSGSANCSWTDNKKGNSIQLRTSCGYNKNIVISAISVTYTNFTIADYCTTIASSADITISSAGYTTYFNSATAYTMPDDCEGYVFTAANGLELAYNAEDVVPAGEPLVIYTIEPGTKTLNFTTSSEQTLKSGDMNDLDGTDAETALTADENSYFYGLSLNAAGELNSVGFYWMAAEGAAFTNGAHKAYLKLPKTTPGAKSAFRFNGDTDAIESVTVKANNVVYNLQGQRVNANTKGIVIVNGKKVFNK